jgi:hypothetical protein
MPGTERAVIIGMCAVALVVVVVWLARSFRRGEFGAPIQMPPLPRSGVEAINGPYTTHDWATPSDDDGDSLRTDPRKPADPGLTR